MKKLSHKWHKVNHGLLCPRLRGGKGTGFVRSRKATENPVTRFPPGQRWWRQPPKGERFSLTRRAIGMFSHGRSPVVKVLYKLAPLPFEGRLPVPFESSRRNQITLSAPHRTVRAVFPHTALRIVLGYHICTRIRGFGI